VLNEKLAKRERKKKKKKRKESLDEDYRSGDIQSFYRFRDWRGVACTFPSFF